MAQNNSAYDFSLFEPYNRSSEAPVIEPEYYPEEQPVPKPHKKSNPKKNQGVTVEERRETISSFVISAKIIGIVAFVFVMICGVIYLNVTLDETSKKITSVQSQIDISKSENVRLSSTLESMVSIEKVEKYAEDVLGMVKLENFRITYFESESDNQVVVSGGKSYDDSGTLAAKIKSLLEYIF